MKSSTLLTALVACGLYAPAPLPRPAPTQVTPGVWTMQWNEAEFRCRLGADGTCSFDDSYRGVWRWDACTRTLTVVEWVWWAPEREYVWSVVLDAEMEGTTDGTPALVDRVRVKFKKGARP